MGNPKKSRRYTPPTRKAKAPKCKTCGKRDMGWKLLPPDYTHMGCGLCGGVQVNEFEILKENHDD